MTSSDHRLVAAQLCLPRLYGISGLWKKRKTDACARLDISKLATDVTVRNEYVGRVQQSINQLNCDQAKTNTPLQHTWEKIMSVIKSDAQDTAGTVTRDQLRRKCVDEELFNISREQREVRLSIQQVNNFNVIQHQKNRRNKLRHSIRRKSLQLAESRLDQQAAEIEKQKDSAKMLKAVHIMKRRKSISHVVAD